MYSLRVSGTTQQIDSYKNPGNMQITCGNKRVRVTDHVTIIKEKKKYALKLKKNAKNTMDHED